jgi:hypothetical protein
MNHMLTLLHIILILNLFKILFKNLKINITMKLYLLSFLLFSLFLISNPDNWKDVAITFMNDLYKLVMEYFIVFQDCFNKSFEGVLNIIDNLVTEYFEVFQSCFNYALKVFEGMIKKYLIILQLLVTNMTSFPNSAIYMTGAVLIVYIIKN